MRSLVWSAAAMLLLAAPSLADDAWTERTLRGSWATGSQRVHIDMPPAKITIETATDGKLSAEIEVTCDSWRRNCRETAGKLALESGPEGDAFRLGIAGMPHGNIRGLSLRGRILVPRGVAVEVDLGVGELKIRDVEGPLDVDVGVGEVKIHSPQRAVHSVSLGVGVGEGSLEVGGRDVEAKGWLGRSVEWGGGSGRSRMNVRVGVGEAHISID